MKTLIEHWESRLSDPDCQRRCQCACGRYQRLKYRGVTCGNCGVIVDVRRAPWVLAAIRKRLRWLYWKLATSVGGVVPYFGE